MEKNTIIAIVLSVVIITTGFYVQEKFFAVPNTAAASQASVETEAPSPADKASGSLEETEPSKVDLSAVSVITNREEDPDYYREINLETEVFDIVFSNLGGTVKSIKLKKHLDGDVPLEMINKNSEELTAFNLQMGDYNAETLKVYFDMRKYTQNDNIIVEFTKDLDIPGRSGVTIPLTIIKKYIFKANEYMMELQVQMVNRNNDVIRLDNNGFAYTLSFGPQIGPKFEKIDNRKEFRKYITVADGKKKIHKMPRGKGEVELNDRFTWAGISGKYFTVIGIPDSTLYRTVFSNSPVDGFDEGARMFFSRPVIKSSNSIDTFRFYIGPKRGNILKLYNDADKNGFSITGLDLDLVLDSGAMLGWLQQILKVLLNFFYGIIPNYGVAILLLTIFVKIVMFPLTHKSYESTSKMSGLSPKVMELKEKYKNNPQKMNQEISVLYKKEGVNPVGGCLPLLLQMPIFIALYGLLSSHFELRGAGFISPWITDLSVADSIFSFAPASIPVIGSDIRLLPILMILTQLLSSKMMQTPDSANNAQMKMMTYMMPLMFLFILYDAPSGLLLYWTMTNVLTVIQQYFVNKFMKKKKSA